MLKKNKNVLNSFKKLINLLVNEVERNLTFPLFIHSNKCSLGDSLSCRRGANFLAAA